MCAGLSDVCRRSCMSVSSGPVTGVSVVVLVCVRVRLCPLFCPVTAQAEMSGSGGPAGGSGGVRHGAVRDGGAVRRRRHQSAPVAAPLQPAHLLRSVPVRQLPSHGAVAPSEGAALTQVHVPNGAFMPIRSSPGSTPK